MVKIFFFPPRGPPPGGGGGGGGGGGKQKIAAVIKGTDLDIGHTHYVATVIHVLFEILFLIKKSEIYC